jgi:hypothetical protein
VTPGAGELAGIEAALHSGRPESAEREAEYVELRERIHDVVGKLVPAGSTVAVVSKGDEELVRLEELRALGADYFVLPSPYLWWLDHYPELAHHLQSRYRLVTDRPDTCLIYHLNEPPLGTATGPAPTIASEPAGALEEAPTAMQLVPPVRELLASLLEPEAGILVVGDGSDEWLSLGREVRHFPQDASGAPVPVHPSRGLALVAQLDALKDRGTSYLLVPRTGFRSVRRSAELVRYLRRCRLIALREQVCAVFELPRGERRDLDPTQSRGSRPGAGVAAPAAFQALLGDGATAVDGQDDG